MDEVEYENFFSVDPIEYPNYFRGTEYTTLLEKLEYDLKIALVPEVMKSVVNSLTDEKLIEYYKFTAKLYNISNNQFTKYHRINSGNFSAFINGKRKSSPVSVASIKNLVISKAVGEFLIMNPHYVIDDSFQETIHKPTKLSDFVNDMLPDIRQKTHIIFLDSDNVGGSISRFLDSDLQFYMFLHIRNGASCHNLDAARSRANCFISESKCVIADAADINMTTTVGYVAAKLEQYKHLTFVLVSNDRFVDEIIPIVESLDLKCETIKF